ncbi:TetR/AcrR family transcriptional regulator [Aeromicrobium sp. Leaf350]|uniref:TetR/AcrR family transcriptional regulator n=1 Tax=Aeromicrobium sp. Leaf350 TaxID=2876565 RepID=UPI001E53FBC4|nr:TetR/AcrR family transcriptional regulator [Aeromicrobium sp. Leaf350]
MAVTPLEGGENASSGKADRRRLELAESAFKTLGELGYARSSLREIAQNSEFSHGVVHYYFSDKIDLITFCVRHYKTACSRRYDAVVDAATTVEELTEGFLATMGATLVEDTGLHRLWYDVRAQSMFEPSLRGDVLHVDRLLEQMTWRVLTRYAELAGRAPCVDAPTAYALVDGLFEQAVIAGSVDPATARANLTARVATTLPLLLTP